MSEKIPEIGNLELYFNNMLENMNDKMMRKWLDGYRKTFTEHKDEVALQTTAELESLVAHLGEQRLSDSEAVAAQRINDKLAVIWRKYEEDQR